MNERQPEGYNVIRDFIELRVEPIEVPMKPRVEYTIPQRVRRIIDQRIGSQFRGGKRG